MASPTPREHDAVAESLPPPGNVDSVNAKKEAILDHVLETLTSNVYGNLNSEGAATRKGGNLTNLGVYIEFKQLLEEDKTQREKDGAQRELQLAMMTGENSVRGRRKVRNQAQKDRLTAAEERTQEPEAEKEILMGKNRAVVHEREETKATLDAQLKKMSSENGKLTRQLAETEAGLCAQKEETDILKTRLASTTTNLSAAGGTVDSLTTRLQRTQSSLREANKAEQALREELSETRGSLDDAGNTNGLLTRRLARTKSSLSDANNTVGTLTEQLDEAKASLKAASKTDALLTKRLARTKSRLSEANEAVEALTEQLDETKVSLSEAEEALEIAREQPSRDLSTLEIERRRAHIELIIEFAAKCTRHLHPGDTMSIQGEEDGMRITHNDGEHPRKYVVTAMARKLADILRESESFEITVYGTEYSVRCRIARPLLYEQMGGLRRLVGGLRIRGSDLCFQAPR